MTKLSETQAIMKLRQDANRHKTEVDYTAFKQLFVDTLDIVKRSQGNYKTWTDKEVASFHHALTTLEKFADQEYQNSKIWFELCKTLLNE